LKARYHNPQNFN